MDFCIFCHTFTNTVTLLPVFAVSKYSPMQLSDMYMYVGKMGATILYLCVRSPRGTFLGDGVSLGGCLQNDLLLGFHF